MKKNLLATLLLLASYCASAAPADGPMSVVERWAKAFDESDVDTIVSLYAPDALFIGTGSKAVVTEPAGVRKYFEAALLRDRPRGAKLLSHSEMRLADGSLILAGLDEVTGVRDGKPTSAHGRITFVVARRGDDWKIVHFHRSAMPQ